MFRFLDWIVYALVLGLVLLTLFAGGQRDTDAPEPLPDSLFQDGPSLPEPSIFDEQILVRVDRPQDGIGTAFAINRQGQWLTARHVVDGCSQVSLLVAPGAYVPVSDIQLAGDSDLALLTTGRSPRAAEVDFATDLRVGELGYHVGYPSGRPGEVVSKLLARSRLITRGERRGEEPVIAWAEMGRTRGLDGSLGGLSGGPVFDSEGRVRGVIVAESPRRGRIYTAAPTSIARFLNMTGAQPSDGIRAPFVLEDYGKQADQVRNSLKVVKVACRVSS